MAVQVQAYTSYSDRYGLINLTWVDISSVRYTWDRYSFSMVWCPTCIPTQLRLVGSQVEMAHYINGQLTWVGDYVPSSLVTGLPIVGSISFASTPSGAEIFIDGADQGVKTPNTFPNMLAGDHTYVLKLAGYNDYSGTVSVVSGQTAAVSAALTPACTPTWKCEMPLNGYETDGCGNRRLNPACNPPQIGNISFVSTPPGAEIFLDDHDQGIKTPGTVSNAPVGTHAYTLKLVGYNDYTGTVSVVLNQTATVSATLTSTCAPAWKCELPLNGYENDGCGNRRLNPACNPPQVGSISFASTPPGAEIFLDGHDRGVVTPNTVSSIPVGTHVYTLRLAGYNDYTGTVNVALNQTAGVTATLVPVTLPQATGSVSFTTSPPGAEIFIDGADQNAKTPYTIYNIPAGDHTYTLKLPGYNDITGTVSVTQGQVATESKALTPSVPPAAPPGVGAGTILALGLLGAGILGAVIYTSREKKPPVAQEYLKYPPGGR